jgi:hypothetical protein
MMHHGILGAINDDLIDVTDDDPEGTSETRRIRLVRFLRQRQIQTAWISTTDKKDYVKIAACL